MPRGERIGDAYVRIHADGDGMAADIREDLRAAGEDGGREFNQGLREGFNKDFDPQDFENAFDRAIGRMQGRLDRLDLTDVRRRFEQTFSGNLGKRLGDNLAADLEEGLRSFDAGSLFGDIDRQVLRARNQLFAEEKKINDERQKNLKNALNQMSSDVDDFFQKQAQDRDREFDAEHDRLAAMAAEWRDTLSMITDLTADALLKQSEDRDREFEANHDRLAAMAAEEEEFAEEQTRANQQVSDLRNRLWRQREKDMLEEQRLLKALTDRIAAARAGTGDYADAIEELHEELEALAERTSQVNLESDRFQQQMARNRLALAQTHPTLRRVNRQWATMADRVGTFTGRGSRNNFLNFVGSVNRNLLRLVGTIGTFAEGVVTAGRTLRLAFADPRVFQELASNFGRFASQGITAAAGLAAGLVLVVTTAGVLSSAISGLTAIVVSLASVIGFTLAGGIGVAVGVLGALGAAVAVGVGAFAALDDAGKAALKEAVEPLTDAFRELGRAAGDELFANAGRQAQRFADLLGPLEPLVRRIATAMRQGVNDILSSMESIGDSPGAANLLRIFENQLPRAIRSISGIVGNLGAALTGIFAGVLPATNQFLNYLEDITADFAAWATSVEGQNAIRDFMEDAGEAAKSLGGFIGSVGEALGELLGASRETGITIFDQMTAKVQEFIGWLTSPEGQTAINDWLAFAEDLATKIGEVVLAAIDLVDALDTPENRELLQDILTLVENITRGFEKLAPIIDDVTNAFLTISEIVPSIGTAFSALGGGEQPWWMSISSLGLFTQLPELAEKAKGAFDTFRTNAGDAVNDVVGFFSALPGRVAGFVNRLPEQFAGLATKIINAAGNLIPQFVAWVQGLPNAARRAGNRIVNGFRNLGGRMITAAGNLAGRFGGWVSSLPGRAQRLGTQIANGFRNLSGRMINAAGSIISRFASWSGALPGRAARINGQIIRAFAGLAGKIIAGSGDLAATFASWAGRAVTAVASVPGRIISLFAGLGSRILSAIGTIDIGSLIQLPDPGGGIPYVPGVASGGTFGQVTDGPMLRWVGEDGPEAIVPLNRDLSMVDPSVRWLSAIAQGLAPPPGSGSSTGSGDVPQITVVTPTQDPVAVAQEVLNHWAGSGY